MFLLCGPDSDFNVMAEGNEKFHEAPDGKVARSVSHQQGELWLTYTKDFGDLDLRHTRGFEDGVDLQGESRFEQLLIWIGKAKVRKDISAAFGDIGGSVATSLSFHFNSAFFHILGAIPSVIRCHCPWT